MPDYFKPRGVLMRLLEEVLLSPGIVRQYVRLILKVISHGLLKKDLYSCQTFGSIISSAREKQRIVL